MKPDEVLAIAANLDDVRLLEPREQFDQCLVGVVERFHSSFVVYSRKCVLEELAKDMDDIVVDDPDYSPDLAALEHYGFNILGGWIGAGTPAFMLDNEETE